LSFPLLDLEKIHLAAAVPASPVSSNRAWLHRWIYYLAAGFMFAAGALRALLIFQDTPYLGQVLLLLGVWLLLFIGNSWLSPRWAWVAGILLGLEAGLVVFLLAATKNDFFAFFFAIIEMQAMRRYSPRVVGVLIGLAAILTYATTVGPMGALQAFALTLIYTAVGALLASYIWSTRRAVIVQEQQQRLVSELQEANRQLEMHAAQQERLAAGRERQRLARELHDSVTQTIFSMTLTTQSALLLLERAPAQVAAQLDRLDGLTASALMEMQELISRLAPQSTPGGGFASVLQQHLQERLRLDNLSVALDVEGDQAIGPAEQAGLFRIAQEALNNIVKHAGVLQAVIRLHLAEPFWMEIEDHGNGFEPTRAAGGGRMGLAGMKERAAEIGWSLQVASTPGNGTRIRVERGREE
jgi:signal transduction histidine kinase